MVCVKIRASEECKRKYSELGFPILFKRTCPEIDDLEPKMREFFDSYNHSPSSQLTAGFSADEILLSTDMLTFLLEEGFFVSKIHYAMEYQRGKKLQVWFWVIFFLSHMSERICFKNCAETSRSARFGSICHVDSLQINN